LLRSAENIDKEELIRRSNHQFAFAEVLHLVLIGAYWIGLYLYTVAHFWSGGNSAVRFMRIGLNTFYLLFSSLLFTNMRSSMLRRDSLIMQFERIRVRTPWLLLAQLACALYVVVLSTSHGPLTASITMAIEDDSRSVTTVCGAPDRGNFNRSYFESYCVRGYELSVSSTALPYICDDGGWVAPGGTWRFRSRYDACLAALSLTEYVVDAYSALGLSFNLFLWHVFDAVGHLNQAAMGGAVDSGASLGCFGCHVQTTRLVQLSVLVALTSAAVYVACILSDSLFGPIATWIFSQQLDIINLAAWAATFIFLNAQVLREKWHHAREFFHSAELPEPLYDVFLSHAWGSDLKGRDSHARVGRINSSLKQLGLVTWFDEERMSGAIDHAMADGIDRSRVVLIFVTAAYIHKVNENDGNNVHFEFDYASRRKSSSALIPVCLEESCKDTRKWRGPVGARLGGKLYHDLSADFDGLGSAGFEEHVAKLGKAIHETIAKASALRPAALSGLVASFTGGGSMKSARSHPSQSCAGGGWSDARSTSKSWGWPLLSSNRHSRSRESRRATSAKVRLRPDVHSEVVAVSNL